MARTAKPKPKRKGGRPSKYSPTMAKRICETIATSSLGLARLIEQNKGWPSRTTIKRWLAEHEEFRAQYAHAREDQAGFLVEETLEIADGVANTPAAAARARLRVETRLKVAALVAPKKYGNKVAVVGGDPAAGDKPVQGEFLLRLVDPPEQMPGAADGGNNPD